MREEFKKFVTRGNVMDMAIGVIIGGAFTAITSALVANVITPLLAVAFNSPNPDALNITLRAAEGEKEAIVHKCCFCRSFKLFHVKQLHLPCHADIILHRSKKTESAPSLRFQAKSP